MGSQNVPPEMNIDFVLKWLSKNGLQISQHKFFGSEPQYRPSSNLSIDQVCIQPGQPDQLHLGPHPAPLNLTTPHTYSHPPPLSLGTPLTHSHPACSQPTYLQTATLHTFHSANQATACQPTPNPQYPSLANIHSQYPPLTNIQHNMPQTVSTPTHLNISPTIIHPLSTYPLGASTATHPQHSAWEETDQPHAGLARINQPVRPHYAEPRGKKRKGVKAAKSHMQ